MNNTTRRRTVALVIALIGLSVALLSSQRHSSTEVVTGDDTTTSGATTPSTTEVPETTTAVSTTTTVVPTTTVVETTTTPPVAESADTSPPVQAPVAPAPATTAAALHTQEDTGVQPVGVGDPAPAARVETGKCVDPAACDPSTTAETTAVPEWAACPQYYNLAIQVGWPESQMRVVMYVMHRESGCDPHAYARQSCGRGNHAMGLMQLCGWLSPGAAYDPATNLSKALELWQSSGWCPWVLRGDPMTGHAC